MNQITINDVAEFKTLLRKRVYRTPRDIIDDGTVDTYRFVRGGISYEVTLCVSLDGEPSPLSFPAMAYDVTSVGLGDDLASRVLNIEEMVAKMLGMMERDAWSPEDIEASREHSPERGVDKSNERLRAAFEAKVPEVELPEDYSTAVGKALNDEEVSPERAPAPVVVTVNEYEPSTRNVTLSKADVPWTDPLTGAIITAPGMYTLTISNDGSYFAECKRDDDDHE